MNREFEKTSSSDAERLVAASTVGRSLFGGFLMGLANLVPGISGGTMLLAAGIYPRFVEAVAKVTRFRFDYRSLVVLSCVGGAAVLSILLLAGTLKGLVVDYRWIMYSLFIGLTLGGIPVVWRLTRGVSPDLIIACGLSFLTMLGLAFLQAYEVVGSGASNPLTLFAAGLAGASAMILPGLSGGYLLLLMGQYVPILSAIDAFKEALRNADVMSAMNPAISAMLPVGLGVVIGVALVGNLLQWLLKHFEQATLGILLGLLVGSVAGLWPFQRGVQPVVGDTIKGQVVTTETIESIDPEDWNTAYFAPDAVQAVSSLGLIAVGFAVTLGVSRIGGKDKSSPDGGS